MFQKAQFNNMQFSIKDSRGHNEDLKLIYKYSPTGRCDLVSQTGKDYLLTKGPTIYYNCKY
jgi:hypothetical protein